METPSTPPSAIDETARRRFEAAWSACRPEPIERYLPPEGDPRYLPTLEELVAIELEFLWKADGLTALPSSRQAEETGWAATRPTPRLAGYLERFPQLNQPDIVQRLNAEASRLRQQYADRPLARERPASHDLVTSDGTAVETTPGGSGAGEPGQVQATLPPEEPDRTVAPVPDSEKVEWLGPYRVLRELGHGGMGKVYLAEDSQLRRPVALKVMLPAQAANPTARQRFLREARAAAAVKHDHIVTIYQVGEDRGSPFLAMELLEGEPLDRWLERNPQPTLAQILRLGREMAEGLAAAHARGLVHRDIKPGNVWLEAPTNRVKILDFGLARLDDDNASLTNSGTLVGTPAYMAPEQARGEGVDPRTDLFSLGSVLYHLCTGRRPFQGGSAMAVLSALAVDTPRPIRDLNPAIPPSLTDLVMRLLEKDPARRPGSAREVAVALQTIAASALPSASTTHLTPSPAALVTPRRESRRRLVAALLVGLAVLLPLAYYFAPAVFRVATDQGDLVVSVDDPEVEVAVRQGGVVVRPRGKAREFLVKAGKGALEVYRPGETEALLVKDFELSRNGRTVVTIRRDELAKKGEEPKPGGDPYRRLAEWVLRHANCHVVLAGNKIIKAGESLPTDPFRVHVVVIAGDVDEETLLALLEPLPEPLGLLEYRSKACTDQTLERLVAAPGARGLVSLKLLDTSVTDSGLRHLQKLSKLRSLTLLDTPVTDEGLKYIRDNLQLSTLSIGGSQSKFTVQGLAFLDPRLKDLSLQGRWVTDAAVDAVVKLPALESVAFTPSEVTDAGALRVIQQLPGLRNLTLSNSKVTDKILPALAACDRLQSLYLRDLPVTDESVKSLYVLKNLKYLNLTMTKVTAAGVRAVQAALPNCKIDSDFATSDDPYRKLAEWVLRQAGSQVVLNGNKTIKFGEPLPPEPLQIKVVHITGDIDEETLLALLEQLPTPLAQMNYMGKARTDQSLERLAAAPGAGALVTLKLNDSSITDAGLRHLQKLPKLQILSLQNTPVTDEGLKYIRDNLQVTDLAIGGGSQSKITVEGLAFLEPRLKSLSLTGPWVTDAAIDAVVKLTGLESITLTPSEVTDAGLVRLVQRFPGLKSLTLGRSKLTDKSLAALAACGRLQTLYLDNMPITDEGLKFLHGLKNLLYLNVGKTKVTAAGVQALQAALPQCKITSDFGADDPYRRLAEWVLQQGPRNAVHLTGGVKVSAGAPLPDKPFTLMQVTLGPGPGGTPLNEEEFLVRLNELPKSLTGLTLTDLAIRDQTLAKLADTSGARDIGSLFLYRVPVTDDCLPQLRQFSKLKGLLLSDTEITDDGLKYIRDNLSLTFLGLGANRQSFTAKGLAHLSPRLQQIDFAGPWVTDAALDELPDLPELKHIHLGQSQVTDAGAIMLIQRFPNMKWLALFNTKLTDKTLAALSACKLLETLTLTGIPVTDEGVKALHGMKQLKTLELVKTKATAAGLKALREALPNCKVTTNSSGDAPSDAGKP